MAIECHTTECPFHGVHQGDDGPLCYEIVCIDDRPSKNITNCNDCQHDQILQPCEACRLYGGKI